MENTRVADLIDGLGLNVARRGWLSAPDILNTRSLPELRRALGRREQRKLAGSEAR